MNNDSSKYPLGHNTEEILRLEKQAKLLSEKSLSTILKNSKNCLEIGCGSGANLETVSAANPKIEFYGMDLFPTAIEFAKQKADSLNLNAHFHTGDAFSLPYKENKFDSVFIRLVLWSVGKNWEKIIQEAYRVLRPGGTLYCFEPDDSFLTFFPPKAELQLVISKWQGNQTRSGRNPFIGKELYSAFNQAGFAEVHASPFHKVSTGQDSESYLEHLTNLKKIFLSKGPEDFGFEQNEPIWQKALEQAQSVHYDDFLLECHFVVVGKKPL